MSDRAAAWAVALAACAVAAAVSIVLLRTVMSEPESQWTSPEPSVATTAATTTTTSTVATTTSTTTTVAPYDGWVDPATSGQAWGTVPGLLTFRGNPTRTYYGKGPLPAAPSVAWRFPDSGAMCSQSSVGGQPRTWCGTGWTGQPAVFEREDRTWVVFGAYSSSIHFLDAHTGQRLRPDFATGDIIKGSVTIDPDGFPLVYSGSRDNKYRVVAFDRAESVELWALHADDVSPVRWNDDWDGSGLVLDDYLFIGGENSQWHVVKLNRGYDPDGLVTVQPELVFNAPGWDDELIAAVGGNVSIENSPAISGNVVYFANSGGLVQGWDISGLADGVAPTRVFRFWTGDDTDASLVIDADGMIYAASQYERGTARSHEVGQILKLDPSRPDDPLVWGVAARQGANLSPAPPATTLPAPSPAVDTDSATSTQSDTTPDPETSAQASDSATGDDTNTTTTGNQTDVTADGDSDTQADTAPDSQIGTQQPDDPTAQPEPEPATTEADEPQADTATAAATVAATTAQAQAPARRVAGVWATPGLHRDLLIVPTHSGEVMGLDTADGTVRWTIQLAGPTWSSPVIVDDVWIQGDCNGRLHGFDVSNTAVRPQRLWHLDLGGCIESTPAVWDGLITVGTRAGWVYGLR